MGLIWGLDEGNSSSHSQAYLFPTSHPCSPHSPFHWQFLAHMLQSICFRCLPPPDGLIKCKTRRWLCLLPNAYAWRGCPWAQPCLSCHDLSLVSIKEDWILIVVIWLFGTLAWHLFGLLGFQINHYSLPQCLVSEFIDLSCGEQEEFGLGNILIEVVII